MLTKGQRGRHKHRDFSLPQVLKNHTKMTLVFEVSLESDHVLFVVGISMEQLLQYFNLLGTSFSPAKQSSVYVAVKVMRA